MMKKVGFGLVALIAVLLAVIIIVPQMIPVSTYRSTLEKQASERLGRTVTIGDELGIKIFPATAFQVSALQIDNPDGFSSPYLMRVGKAEIGVKLLPLLSKEVEITKFVLTEPSINLEKTKSGAVNWELASEAQPQEASGDDGASGGAAVNDIRLGDVRIVNGVATYKDAAANQNFELADIDVDVTLSSMEKPLTAKGTLTFDGAPATLDMVMTTPGAFMRQEATNVKFSMDLATTSAGGDLAVTFNEGGDIGFSGPISANVPDLPAFAALLGSPLPEAPGFDSFSVKGTLNGTPNVLRLAKADIQFDAIEATGDLRLQLTGPRPKASGTLTTPALDLRPYIPEPVEADAGAGFPAWSDAPMDFSSLRTIDAELEISTQNIYLSQMQFGESRMTLTIDNGRMTAEIPQLDMYEGSGSGRLVVNARQKTPSFAGNFKMTRVDAEPFSKDVLSMNNLLGLGGFTFNFNASGASQAAIIASLDGDGGFDVADGALKGFNVAKLARAASSFKQGINPVAVTDAISSAGGADEATDFSSFLSSFTMNNGVITAPTINLTSPVLMMNGEGTINLPKQTVDLRMTPRASLNANAAAQENNQGVAIPMQISGTFSQPKVSIDLAALLRGEVGKQLRGVLDGAVGDKLKGNPAGGLLDNVLGGGTSDETEDGGDEEDSVEDVAKDAIGSLFGRRKKDKNNDNQ